MDRSDAAAVSGFLVVALSLTFAAGEAATRFLASRTLIYNIEMVRYAKELKMADPLGEIGHVHRPNTQATLMGVHVAINSLGDRGTDLSEARPAGRKRVLAVGSSVTMGWGVPQSEVFTSLVEKRLNDERPFGAGVSFEFENAGIGNTNACAELKLLERRLPRLKPDLVLLDYFVPDADARPRDRSSPILKHSYFADYLFNSLGTLRFLFGAGEDLSEHYRRLYARDSEAWGRARDCVARMRDDSRAAGAPFVVMISPDLHDLSSGSPYAPLYREMERAFRELGVPTFDAFDEFSRRFGGRESSVRVAEDDPHPNAAGHAVMAELLYRYLVREDPLRSGRARRRYARR